MTGLNNPGNVFSINDWYWIIAGDQSKAYSSRLGDYILTSDPAYVAWSNTGSKAAPAETEAILGQILAGFIDTLPTKSSTSLPIQQAIRQAELDKLLVANADMVTLIQGGQSTTTTATTVATYLSNGTNNYRSLRAQIANAATPAAVRAININAGWPPNP